MTEREKPEEETDELPIKKKRRHDHQTDGHKRQRVSRISISNLQDTEEEEEEEEAAPDEAGSGGSGRRRRFGTGRAVASAKGPVDGK